MAITNILSALKESSIKYPVMNFNEASVGFKLVGFSM